MFSTTDAARENQPSGSHSHGTDTTLHPEEQSSSGLASEVNPSIIGSPNPSWYETWWEKLQSYIGSSWAIADDSADNPGASRQRTELPDLEEPEPQSSREEREDLALHQERRNRWRSITHIGHEEHYRHIVPDPTEQLNESLGMRQIHLTVLCLYKANTVRQNLPLLTLALRKLCLSEYKEMTPDDKKLVNAANDVYSDMTEEYKIQPDDQKTFMLGVILQGGPGGSASRNLIGREIRDPSYIDLEKEFLTRLQKKMIGNDTKPEGKLEDTIKAIKDSYIPVLGISGKLTQELLDYRTRNAEMAKITARNTARSLVERWPEVTSEEKTTVHNYA